MRYKYLLVSMLAMSFILSACSNGHYDDNGNFVGNNGEVYVPATQLSLRRPYNIPQVS